MLLATIPGIHTESVPSGPDVLQVVLYKTDDEELGIGMGPEHWILVGNKKETYEPEVYPVMEDHGLEVNNPLLPTKKTTPLKQQNQSCQKKLPRKLMQRKRKRHWPNSDWIRLHKG